MSYVVRDRPDGQVEILFSRPILVGIFPARETATTVCAFLNDGEPELPPDEPARFSQASTDVAEAEDDATDLSEIVPDTPAPVRKARPARSNLPATVPEKPKAPAQIQPDDDTTLTPDQAMQAFARIQQGERIIDIAKDFGVSMGHLRSRWALHKRYLQQHMAEGGQQACTLCAHPFTPSISNPDTCARCSK